MSNSDILLTVFFAFLQLCLIYALHVINVKAAKDAEEYKRLNDQYNKILRK